MRGAPLDARDAAGRTPAHSAAARSRFEALLALMSLGTDVQARDDEGTTVWELARAAAEASESPDEAIAVLEEAAGQARAGASDPVLKDEV